MEKVCKWNGIEANGHIVIDNWSGCLSRPDIGIGGSLLLCELLFQGDGYRVVTHNLSLISHEELGSSLCRSCE